MSVMRYPHTCYGFDSRIWPDFYRPINSSRMRARSNNYSRRKVNSRTTTTFCDTWRCGAAFERLGTTRKRPRNSPLDAAGPGYLSAQVFALCQTANGPIQVVVPVRHRFVQLRVSSERRMDIHEQQGKS